MKQGDYSSQAVELRGVSKRFGPHVILDRIDLTVAAGEVFVLVGPSGSGKSTLLKLVSGIESPDEGSVWLAGRDATAEPPFRRAVHTVFQNYALFPHLDVAGNVAFPLAVAGVPRAERQAAVERALGWVKLERHARRRVDTLSGGERQRVALARALVDQPQCVLLDEPLSALDPHLRAATLDLLKDVQARLGVTYLYITHDREEALRIGHRMGVLNHGRLEQVGTPEEVYRQPRTPFVASFVGPMNWLRATSAASNGQFALRLPPDVLLPFQIPNAGQTAAAWQVGIRPEDLRLEAAAKPCALPAKMLSRQFAGQSQTVRVALADGTEVVLNLRTGDRVPPVGEAVRIGWDLGAMHVFPEGQEGRA